MADGAAPRSTIEDEVSSAIKIDLKYLWRDQEELRKRFEGYVHERTLARSSALKDDALFRSEIWKRINHHENLKYWVLGGAFFLSLVVGLVWSFGNEIAQMRLSRIVQAQSDADRSYFDARINAIEKALNEINNKRQEDPIPADTVRRRR